MGNKFMKTGISLYFSNGVEKNEAIIRKARKAGIRYAFTSMHIPEETGMIIEEMPESFWSSAEMQASI